MSKREAFIRREMKKLKAYESDEEFALAAWGASAALAWILWKRDGYMSPSNWIKFGVTGRENMRRKRKADSKGKS